MQALRAVANEVKPDFWLMGEVIHGDYTRWVNEGTLHSVTNYQLHKALYSGHNDHNYFEIAHTVKNLYAKGGNRPDGLKLYNFVDNHDVERIYTKLNKKEHFAPVHILLYTLPGVPSIYYGSEFGIEGRKERFSDDSLRPALSLSDYKDAIRENSFTRLIAALGKVRKNTPALSYGDYKELLLTNRQYAFSRNYNGESVLVTVNNDDSDYVMTLPAGNVSEYAGALSGERVTVSGGNIVINVKANAGDIWLPVSGSAAAQKEAQPVVLNISDAASRIKTSEKVQEVNITAESKARETSNSASKAKASDQVQAEKASEQKKEIPSAVQKDSEEFQKGRIAGLQEAILAIMEKNGPVTDQMRKDVLDNVYHDSLITWIKSFR